MLNLHTGRFVLRPMCAADAIWIAREIANPLVHCWLSTVPNPYDVTDSAWFIERFAENPGFKVVQDAGNPLGIISIERASSFDAARSHTPELGYWLAKHAWGRGVMSEAAQAMVDWFFETGRGDVIASGWIAGNTRSAHVLAKLGFRRTGETVMRYAHFHGKEVPIERVTLTKDHWQCAKPG
ncbi:MAG: GNAT family N-acetyltransferase [Pelagimonas sp.]|uniref:GNAT family N-acetyltransferase n=1 Tax=Pelagimonas sp. TaxID=2073170 RepID=UPI003D6B7D9A